MTRFTSFVLLVLLAFAAGCGKNSKQSSPDSGTTTDQARFQGVWKGVSFDPGGGAKELPAAHSPRLQVEGSQVILRETTRDPGEAYTAIWDETKNPKTLTLSPLAADVQPRGSGKSEVWIYKFEGDDLVLAFNREGTTPTEFKGDAATGVKVLRFKKTDETLTPIRNNPGGSPTTAMRPKGTSK